MLIPNVSSSNDAERKVVIIGGGLIGLTVARRLMRVGYQHIVVLERQDNNIPRAQTHPPAGLIHRYHPSRGFRRTLRKSVDLLRSFQSKLASTFFDVTSSLLLGSGEDREGLSDSSEEAFRWSSLEDRNVPNSFRREGVEHPFWFGSEEDGLGSAKQMKSFLQSILQQSDNVSLRYRSEVKDGHREHGEWKLYVSGSNVVEASDIIIASGVHSNQVGERLGLRKEPYAVMRRNLFLSRQNFVPDRYGFFQDRLEQNTFRDVHEGTVISSCDEQPVDLSTDPDKRVRTSNAAVSRKIQGTYPDLPSIHVRQSWTSLFAQTSDQLPIIKHDRKEQSVIWVTGMNEFNLTIALWVGHQVQQLMDD